jgi:hypothetical protein
LRDAKSDSHADTCVAGPNFRIDEYTGEHCDVTPYSSEYKPLKDVPIVNASTAYTDESTGETLVLRFNQVLWYGNRLGMSLINPNQIRHYGLTVSDDPTDKTRKFGITGEDFIVPFDMSGTTVFSQVTSTHTMGDGELPYCGNFFVTRPGKPRRRQYCYDDNHSASRAGTSKEGCRSSMSQSPIAVHH